MHLPFVSPRILQVTAGRTPDGFPVTWVEFEAVTGPGDETQTFDLFVADDAASVAASIERAAVRGPLVVLADDTDGTNPTTGRPWIRGFIGPMAEMECPPFSHLIAPPDGETDTVLFAPKVLRIVPAPEVSTFFAPHPTASCLDLAVGEDGDVVHIVVPMAPADVRAFLDNARIIRRPIVLFYGQTVGVTHAETGRTVYIGHLSRLGAENHA